MPTNTLRTSAVMAVKVAVDVSSTNSISVERPRLEGRLLDRCVRRAHDRVAVPGDREHHPAVARVGHHDRRPAGQDVPVEDEVDPLARGDERSESGIGEPPHRVAERAPGVDDDVGLRLDLPAALEVAGTDAVHEPVLVAGEGGHRGVVQEGGALLGRGRGHVHEQPRVVELSVVV
jgi:hypothetical protein